MWSRLCVDVDNRGNVRGCSVEMHDTDGPTTVWTTAIGPFDDAHAALETALLWQRQHLGAQATLF